VLHQGTRFERPRAASDARFERPKFLTVNRFGPLKHEVSAPKGGGYSGQGSGATPGIRGLSG